jgi:hypothetical protein
MTDPDEAALSKLAKKMLSAPPKERADMKVGGRQAKLAKERATMARPSKPGRDKP